MMLDTNYNIIFLFYMNWRLLGIMVIGIIGISIMIIVKLLSFLYYYHIYGYLTQLKDDELCNELNSPLLTIYRNIIIVYSIFILVAYILLYSGLTVNENKLVSFIFRHRHILVLFNLLLALTLLYNISLQDKCKDIQPNFRIFLFIMNITKIIFIIHSLFFKEKRPYKVSYKPTDKLLNIGLLLIF